MSTLSDRLNAALTGPPRLSQADLARACGVKPPSVSDWISGKTKRLSGSNLLAAARFLGVNPEWLASGKGPREPGPDTSSQSVSLDEQRMREAAQFLEELFHQHGKEFVASERVGLLLAVYSELADVETPNVVAMTMKFGRLIGGANDGKKQAGGAGKAGGSGDRRRAG
jgi:transcriptional regulator with XRE-family HTH domain